MNPYVGNSAQLCGVERHRIEGGRGDGLEILEVTNGRGLEMMLCPGRNNDILRLRADGINLGFFSPCGYAHPAYFDNRGDNFLKNFTAGYMTTCGFENVGTPNNDGGEALGLHGSIGNTPCEQYSYEEKDDEIVVRSITSDEFLFKRKWKLKRTICVSKKEKSFSVTDRIANTSMTEQPLEVLYHQNMGYPLLDEDSVLEINSSEVVPRNEHAREDLENWMKLEKPDPAYEERCYYHFFKDSEARISLYQPKLKLRLTQTYDPKVLGYFTEWKMMGVREYVLGLECGNCTPDGRELVRKAGNLVMVKPGEEKFYTFKITIDHK